MLSLFRLLKKRKQNQNIKKKRERELYKTKNLLNNERNYYQNEKPTYYTREDLGQENYTFDKRLVYFVLFRAILGA